MQTVGRGGIKVDPPSEIFAKFVNQNTIKPKKVVPFSKIFTTPYKPSPQKFGNNLKDLPTGLSNHVHL